MKLKEITDIKLTDIKLPKKLSIPINPKLVSEFLFHKDKRAELFAELPLDKRVDLLRSLTTSVRRDVLMHIPEQDIADIIEVVDPDESTDLLQLLTRKKREKVLLMLSQELKSSISTLLEFDAETAAGLMTLDYVQVEEKDNIATVAKKFKQHEKRTGRPPVILALKDEGKLAGFLPGHELGFARKTEQIGKYIKRMPSISYAATHDEVMDMFISHPHAKVAVLNDSGAVMGIIYSDDIIKLMQETEASTLYDFAGIHQEETVSDSARLKVKNRYRWLVINVFTAFLAAFTVSRFEGILNEYVLLAAYMPIVAGMGGNASMQTFAVLVRGISLGQIDLASATRTLRNELGAAFINGLIIATLVSSIAIVLNGNPQIGLVLALAMIINLTVAAFFGTLVPLVMNKLGKDPATSASIFITTATDVLGFLAFLGLATIILG